MDRLLRGYFRQAAELRYLKLKRQDFQTWFGQIMQKAHPANYENIRLTQGDGGLDGILINEGAVFQVYAPREQGEREIAEKIQGDFAAAQDTMKSLGAALRSWMFVHNDEGLTKVTGPALVRLRQANPGVTVECWTFERIWQELEGLGPVVLTDMFGPGPTEQNVDRLQFAQIRDVISHLRRVEASLDAEMVEVEPDPEKLEHNKLAGAKADMLRVGRRRERLVEMYLNGVTGPTTGEDIAEGFRRRYAELRDSGMSNDGIFNSLWGYAGGEHFVQPDEIAAVTAVLAYFFGRCDIFENVPRSMPDDTAI